MLIDHTVHRLRTENPQQDWLLTGLKLAILGAILLPLVPIWSGVYSLLAIGWLWQTAPSKRHRLSFTLLALALVAVYLFGWINSAVSGPVDHLINGFIYVFGLPVGSWPSAASLCLQILLVGMLAHRMWPGASTYERAFISVNVGFALWSALSSVAAIIGDLATEPGAVLIAASVWVNWACLGLLATALIKTSRDLLQLVQVFVLAAAVLAVGMGLQLAIGDYSYVLTSANTADFFERVRGSYYYHAPPVQMLTVALPLAFALLVLRGHARTIGIVIAVAISAVVLLNSTRGLSLALVVGLITFVVIITLCQRNMRLAILPLVLLVGLFSQIFYVKPGTVHADPAGQLPASVAVVEPTPIDGVKAPVGGHSVDTFISSNAARSDLASAGIRAVLEHPVIGSGPGNAQLQTAGNGRPETSSHVLGLDLAAMTGLPGLLFFAALFGLPAIRLAIGLVTKRNLPDAALRAGLLASLAVFAVSSLFHPQERSEIIALAFLLSGLAMTSFRFTVTPEANAATTSIRKNRTLGAGALVIVTGFVACIFVTSPSYVFPAVEFVLRYRQPLMETKTDIVTNSALLGTTVSAGLALAGIPQQVRIMADDPAELALEDGYVLWSPSREKEYPRLREAAGIVVNARYGQWMGINIPPKWWMLDSFQPNIQFLKAGAITGLPVGVEGLESIPIAANQTFAFSPHISPGAQPVIDVTLHGPDGNTSVLQHGDSSIVVNFNQPETVSLDSRSGEQLTVTSSSADATLTVTEQPSLLPSLSPEMQVRAWVDGVERPAAEASNLNDNADLGGVAWPSQSTAIVELKGETSSFGAYMFKPMTSAGQVLAVPREWIMEVQRADGGWTMLDERQLADAASVGGYFVKSTEEFTLLRITFTPDSDDARPPFVGLGEIALFPLSGRISP